LWSFGEGLGNPTPSRLSPWIFQCAEGKCLTIKAILRDAFFFQKNIGLPEGGLQGLPQLDLGNSRIKKRMRQQYAPFFFLDLDSDAFIHASLKAGLPMASKAFFILP
jgi:hypothetical protein